MRSREELIELLYPQSAEVSCTVPSWARRALTTISIANGHSLSATVGALLVKSLEGDGWAAPTSPSADLRALRADLESELG